MYRYIVVDDESLIRRAIVKKIASLDLPLAWVGEAEDGEEALALALREKPDIVFTDMRMPAMDGVSLLRELADHQPEMALIIISGYSDFEYTREAIAANVIDYILKPFDNHELLASLEKAMNFLSRHAAQRQSEQIQALAVEKERLAIWLCRNCPDERAPLRKDHYCTETIQALLSSEVLAVGVLTRREVEQDPHDAAFKKQADDKITQGLLPDGESSTYKGVLQLQHPEDPSLSIVLVGAKTGANRKASQWLQRELTGIENSGATGLAAVSQSYNNPELLRAAYREAMMLLERRVFGQRSGLLLEEAVTSELQWQWGHRDDLLCEIEQGRVHQAVGLSKALFRAFGETGRLTFAQARAYCIVLAGDIEERRPKDKQDAEIIRESQSVRIEVFRQIMNELELEQIFVSLVHETTGLVLAGTATAAGQISQIQQYIDQRYTQPIRLEEVAERFHLHPVYLSMVFKENTGETFQDYLKRLRITRAQELLVSTSYRIDRIAGLVGYDNAKYFYKVFKKETDLTPADFRRQNADITP